MWIGKCHQSLHQHSDEQKMGKISVLGVLSLLSSTMDVGTKGSLYLLLLHRAALA